MAASKESTDFFLITRFKESKSLAAQKDLKVTINFYKKLCLPAKTCNKKHLSKQVLPIPYTLEKKSLDVDAYEGFSVVSFQAV